jgi:hypothetical protein
VLRSKAIHSFGSIYSKGSTGKGPFKDGVGKSIQGNSSDVGVSPGLSNVSQYRAALYLHILHPLFEVKERRCSPKFGSIDGHVIIHAGFCGSGDAISGIEAGGIGGGVGGGTTTGE